MALNIYGGGVGSAPLAETFKIPAEKTSGCFITSVDLFFAQKLDNETMPVSVEISDTLNGYPGQTTLFNAVASNTPENITASTDGVTPTRFRFAGPVFLEPNREYTLKVFSNSVNYKVWISQLGEASITDPTKLLTTQPYLGSLFRSQNNSAWIPDQLQDLMFTLYYAKFSATTGLVTVQNLSNQYALAFLPVNPFMVANGSTVCKVYFPNHGLFVGGYVTIIGASSAVFNNTFSVISVVDNDHVTITLGTSQTFNGLTGGSAVRASKSIRYDTALVKLGNFSRKAGAGIGVTMYGATSTTKDAISTSIPINGNYNLKTGAHYIHSDLNESTLLGGSKSLDINLNIFSNSTDISPIINLSTLTFLAMGNRVNTPSSATNTVVDNNTIASALAGITFTITTNVIGIPVTQDINQYKIGANITITGTASNNITTEILDIDTSTNPYKVFVSGTLANESPATTTIVQAEGYVDEISPVGGTALSKYQTIPITLEQPASGLQIMFSANIPPAADIRLYYRSIMSTSSKSISKATWTLVPTTYRNSQGDEFLDQTYKLNALPLFNAAQFKIVLISTDTTKVPLIRDFRAICLA